MTQHTPGPWTVNEPASSDHGNLGIIARGHANGFRVAYVPVLPMEGLPEEARANARLIAGAPIMLATLQRIAAMTCDHGAGEFCPRTEARAAIATATGQE